MSFKIVRKHIIGTSMSKRAFGTYADSEGLDRLARMRRVIWSFAGHLQKSLDTEDYIASKELIRECDCKG